MINIGRRKNKGNLFDNQNGLFWKKYDSNKLKLFQSDFDEIREWSENSSVQEYISSKISLDVLFSQFINDKTYAGLYFCYDAYYNFSTCYLA